MYIFLGLLVEVGTIICSKAIDFYSVSKELDKLAKDGYKLDSDRLKKYGEELKRNTSIPKKALIYITSLLPVVNIIKSLTYDQKRIKEEFDDLSARECLVPMTNEEIQDYEREETKKDKLFFLYSNSNNYDNDKKEEYLTVYLNKLPSLQYSLDEVKRLNETTGYPYVLGKMDDVNIALLGVPYPNVPIDRISFEYDYSRLNHKFERINEEEAQNLRFEVYPFTKNEEKDEEFRKIILDIKQNRKDAFKIYMESKEQDNKEPVIEEKPKVLSKKL
jgi:hypothetical protein